MDSTSTYLFKGMGEGQMKKILAVGKEISIGFERIEELEKAVAECGLKMVGIPKEALFLAGKAFVRYRKGKGKKVAPLPDFFIGAHAAIEGLELVTRDVRRIKAYFPSVSIISPYQ